MPLEGRCNCNRITVSISDEIANTKLSAYCHCANCRRQSGAGMFWVSCHSTHSTSCSNGRAGIQMLM